jgi:hypothetical protein
VTDLVVRGVTRDPNPLWKVAQLGGVLALVVLLVGLFTTQELALNVLWNGAVPLLPAVFLISPPLWRNVCPLATLNMVGNGNNSRNGLAWREPAQLERWGGVGILLLLILVPARRLFFNVNGPVLAVVILFVGVLALLMGFRFASKSGFCNTICPVLSVERLYGQSPLLRVGNPRCQPCVICSRVGCLDRSPDTAAIEATGLPGRERQWIFTPFGAFALAFPGFVFAYNQLSDSPLSEALTVYGTVALWMAISLAIGVGLKVAGLGRTWLLRLAAVAAIGLYYWFAAPAVQTSWNLPAEVIPIIRSLALGLIAYWFATSVHRSNATEALQV